jgi:hypothetical protein
MAVPLCCEPHTPSATAAAHSSLPNRAGTGAHLLGLVGLGLCCCSCFSAMYWHTAGGEEVAVQASKQPARFNSQQAGGQAQVYLQQADTCVNAANAKEVPESLCTSVMPAWPSERAHVGPTHNMLSVSGCCKLQGPAVYVVSTVSG